MQKRFHFTVLFIIIGSLTINAQGTFQKNLLDVSVWSGNLGTVTTGAGTFTAANGSAGTNSIIWDTDPFGRKSLIWKCISDGNNGPDGGWVYDNIPVNDQKAYRLTIWMKKTNTSTTGNLYFGCRAVKSLDDVDISNPYFGYFPNSDARFQVGKWYLWVGYIHASNDQDVQSYGGVYDGETGRKITNLTDYKLKAGLVIQAHRVFDYYDLAVGSETRWYGPRFEEINGAEPTLEQLLGVTGQSATLNKNAYIGGKLSIGTVKYNDPDYNLFAETGVRTRKVKVDQDNWPDYVFHPSYPRPSLDSLKQFIQQHGHLPEMPTAKEVEKNGIDLGDTQALLLKKIEELTLIVIEQETRMKKMEKILRMNYIDFE